MKLLFILTAFSFCALTVPLHAKPATAPVSAKTSSGLPPRRDTDQSKLLENFRQTDKLKIKTYLSSLRWLDSAWVESRQNELFAHLKDKLRSEVPAPRANLKDLMGWRTVRHRHAYTTEMVDGTLRVVPPEEAAWKVIAEDLRVSVQLLNSNAPEEQRKAAFSVVTADMPLIGAILGDAHAARLTYEGFLLPFLDLGNPEPGKWPSQGQILADSYVWIMKDESPEIVKDISEMMLRFGDEWYDSHYRQVFADVTRYVYGDYLLSHGHERESIVIWRQIKAPNLIAGAKIISDQTEKQLQQH